MNFPVPHFSSAWKNGPSSPHVFLSKRASCGVGKGRKLCIFSIQIYFLLNSAFSHGEIGFIEECPLKQKDKSEKSKDMRCPWRFSILQTVSPKFMSPFGKCHLALTKQDKCYKSSQVHHNMLRTLWPLCPDRDIEIEIEI